MTFPADACSTLATFYVDLIYLGVSMCFCIDVVFASVHQCAGAILRDLFFLYF
jgi:hypothetical protein